MLEDEAIRVVVLHLRGKAFAWWIFESFSLRNVNIASYANLTKALVKGFDGRILETHMMGLHKEGQKKPLHENAMPLHRKMEEAKNLNQNLLEKELSSHILKQWSMGISFPKEDPIIERLPNHVANIEGNSVVRSRVDLAPHVEGRGALAPHRGILASLQGSPQDLMYGDQGTSHVLPVPLLRRCGNFKTQGGNREKA